MHYETPRVRALPVLATTKGHVSEGGPVGGNRRFPPRSGQCEQPEPQPPTSSGGVPSSTWKLWPQPHEELAFGLSILKPDSASVSRKSIVAPFKYGALNGSTTTFTSWNSSSRSP